MSNRILINLERAIQTMRDAMEQAERNARGGDASACQRVIHDLAWGFANASGSIECALSAVEDERDKYEAQRLDAMNDDERLGVFMRYCRFCGSKDPNCCCTRDD